MNYYNEIKQEFINNEIRKKAKEYSIYKNDLITYYKVGKLLFEAQGGEKRAQYGNHLIQEYSIKLTKELGKGYSTRSLKLMRKFYLFQKGQPMVAQSLSWSHYTILLSLNDNNKILYYSKICDEQNLSKRQLQERIKSNDYERLSDKVRTGIKNNNYNTIEDYIKNPIILKNIGYNNDFLKEKTLQKIILEDIESFMKELGNGYSFIGSEYKIRLNNHYNYIDLLFYNIIFRCYVVVELKVMELKKEHIGQIQVYMNYIDENVKTSYENKTIGIIICKKNNQYIIEYSSDKRIISREFLLF